MQQHMIPIPVSAIANACNIFKKVHEDFRLHFHEIQVQSLMRTYYWITTICIYKFQIIYRMIEILMMWS